MQPQQPIEPVQTPPEIIETSTEMVESPVPSGEQAELAQPADQSIAKPKKERRQRHFLIAFFFSFMWGTFGVDRFYMGYIGIGIFKALTLGGFGILTLVDFVLITSGAMKDKQRREMLQVAEYKKFASRTVLWFAIILGLVILINGLLLIYTGYQLITGLMNGGGINGLLGGSGLSSSELQQLQSAGVDPSQLKSLGL